MGFEPAAGRRLRLVAQMTRDPVLRDELARVLEEPTMAEVPSAGLTRAIASCPACRRPADDLPPRSGLCEEHRARWNREICTAPAADASPADALEVLPEAPALEGLIRDALATRDGGVELLAAFQRQQRALDAVWEAHRRGAARVPDAVMARVEAARAARPRFLTGAQTLPVATLAGAR